MSSYAVVKLGPSQQKVSQGDVIVTDRVEGEIGDKITINDVYLTVDGDSINVGTPLLDTNVIFEIVSHERSNKVRVHKFKAKSRYNLTHGHRSYITKLKVLSIGSTEEKKEKKTTKK